MNSETSNFTKTNITRCLRCRRCSDENLWRFSIGVTLTETGNVDVGDFTVKDGSNCCCTSTTNRIISNVFAVIDDIHRRCIGITFTTSQQFDVGDSATSNIHIENLCANRINDFCSRNSFVSLTTTENFNSVESTVSIEVCHNGCNDCI